MALLPLPNPDALQDDERWVSTTFYRFLASIESELRNKPAFSAWQSSAQTALPVNTATKVQFQTEDFDTNDCFDNVTNYRFKPNVGGYYQINGALRLNGSLVITLASDYFRVAIYKNGSLLKAGCITSVSCNSPSSVVSSVVFLNGSTDYVELFVITPTSLQPAATQQATFFNGCFLRSK